MGRNVTYTLNLQSNVSQILARDEAATVRMDNSMWQLQKTMASFGVGLGAQFLINAGKEWIKGAADFELAMLRIKNASSGNFGVFNKTF